MKVTKKIVLSEHDMPTQWYNIVADMPTKPLPMLQPARTKQLVLVRAIAVYLVKLYNKELLQWGLMMLNSKIITQKHLLVMQTSVFTNREIQTVAYRTPKRCPTVLKQTGTYMLK